MTRVSPNTTDTAKCCKHLSKLGGTSFFLHAGKKIKIMAKYSKAAGKSVAKAVRKKKRGTLKSGRSGKTVKSRKQAIAIGLSEARKKGAKVPKKGKKSSKKSSRKKGAKKSSRKKSR